MFNKKKRFFNEKIDQVTKSIWELEFKVAKSAQVREGVRKDRDQNIDILAQVEAQLKPIKDKKLREPLEKKGQRPTRKHHQIRGSNEND